MAFIRVVEVKYSKPFRLTYFIRSFCKKIGRYVLCTHLLNLLTLISESLMAEK